MTVRMSAVVTAESTGGSSAATLSEALAGMITRLECCLAEHVSAASLVVVGGRTRVDEDGLRALRRLALQGGLYLVGTDAVVLGSILQRLHLERGVYPRLAQPTTLEATVRAAAAEASGTQERVLRRTEDVDHGVRTLFLDFELTEKDTRVVIEVSNIGDAAEVSVVQPGQAAYRLTRSLQRKGTKLVLAPGLASIELAATDDKPWSGNWSLRIEERDDGRNLDARGFAGRGPILIPRCTPVFGADAGIMKVLVSFRAEDGGTLTRLRVEPASTDASAPQLESDRYRFEQTARTSRLDALSSESGQVSSAGGSTDTLDITIQVAGNVDLPRLLDLRLRVDGATASGAPFCRLLRVAPYRLVPRGRWRQCESHDTQAGGQQYNPTAIVSEGLTTEAVLHATGRTSVSQPTALAHTGKFVRPAPGAPIRLVVAKPAEIKLAHPVMLRKTIRPRLRPTLIDLKVISKLPVLNFPVLPEPSPSSPIRVGSYLLWPDTHSRTAWFMLAVPERAEFSLVVEQDSEFRITGASATMVASLFPTILPKNALSEWISELQRAGIPVNKSWNFEPLGLTRLDAVLELPDGHARRDAHVTTNPRLGNATLLVELSVIGAQVWHQSLAEGAAPPGVCNMIGWYVSGQDAAIAARKQKCSATLSALLASVSSEAVRSLDPEIAVDATLRVDGDPTIESMTIELRASNGTVRTETFAAEGGEMTMRMLVEDPSAERIDWQVRVVFTAPFLEGATSPHTGFETSSRASTTVLVPRPPSELPGSVKLTVFALRNGLDAIVVRLLDPDEEWVLVKVYANARIEILTNRTPASETSREPVEVMAAVKALETLYQS